MNNLLLQVYNIYSRLLYRIFNTIKTESFNLKIIDRSISFPMVSAEKLLFGNVKGKKVLDLGTGCGIIALHAKKKGASYVLGTDINPIAIKNARINLKNNFQDKKNIDFKKSDLFKDIKDKFDIIVFHAPYFNQKPTNIYEYKSFGKNLISKLLKQGRKCLNKNGEIRILMPSSKSDYLRKLALHNQYKFKIKNHKVDKSIKLILIRIFFRLIYHPKLSIYIFT